MAAMFVFGDFNRYSLKELMKNVTLRRAAGRA
jgi:hypothetical protein